MTKKNEIKFNGRTTAEWKEILEVEEASIAKLEGFVLDETKEIAKAAKKKDMKAIENANRRLTHQIKMLNRRLELIEQLKGFIKTSERYDLGHKEILDFLDNVFEEDMKWYKALKEEFGSMSMKEAKEEGASMNEYLFAKLTEEEASKTFKNDLETRYKKMIAQIEKKVGSIESFDLVRNGNFSFDGTVTGELGTAKITTIGAGGYNIQRAHYRTLVKK